MVVKPGYKQTEVGVIPEIWEVKKIKEIATILTGYTPPTHDETNYGDEFLFVSPGDMGEIKYITTSEKMLSRKGFAITRRFPKGSILFVCIGSTIGKCGIAQVELTSNQQINAILPSSLFSIDYLYYFVSMISPIIRASAGEQAVPIVNKSRFSENIVALPSLPEQFIIASSLSDLDVLITSLDRCITKKRSLKQAATQDLLTGKRRLPGFIEEWASKRLGEVLIRVVNGAVYKPTNSFGLPITRIETISDGTISFDRIGYAEPTHVLANYRLECGDILFSHINSLDHIGKVAIFNGESELYHGMNLLLLRAGPSIDFKFLFYWLGSYQGRKKSISLAKQAVNQASINTNELKGIELPYPTLPEQLAIATVLSDMDAELAALVQKRDKTKAIKQGMMQELLTGRIRLT